MGERFSEFGIILVGGGEMEGEKAKTSTRIEDSCRD